jgi:hypothetical protein
MGFKRKSCVSDKEMPCKGFRRRPQRRSKKMRECAKEEVVDSHYDVSLGGVFYVKEEEEFNPVRMKILIIQKMLQESKLKSLLNNHVEYSKKCQKITR